MVGFSAEDGHGAVDLLDKKETYHLMREGHLREGDLAVGPAVDFGGETVRPTDNEEHILSGRHAFLQIIGKFDGAVFATVLIEEYNESRRADGLENEVAFLRFLLVLREALGVLEFGYYLKVEGQVVSETLAVVVDEGNYMRISRFADYEKSEFHSADLDVVG